MTREIEKAIKDLVAHVEKVERENAELRSTVAYLGKSNDEMCDEIFALKNQKRAS